MIALYIWPWGAIILAVLALGILSLTHGGRRNIFVLPIRLLAGFTFLLTFGMIVAGLIIAFGAMLSGFDFLQYLENKALLDTWAQQNFHATFYLCSIIAGIVTQVAITLEGVFLNVTAVSRQP